MNYQKQHLWNYEDNINIIYYTLNMTMPWMSHKNKDNIAFLHTATCLWNGLILYQQILYRMYKCIYDGLVRRRCDSLANLLELHVFCIIQSMFIDWFWHFDPYEHRIWLDWIYRIWGPWAHLGLFSPIAVHDNLFFVWYMCFAKVF